MNIIERKRLWRESMKRQQKRRKSSTNSKYNNRIDMMYESRQPGREYSQIEIADYVGCHRSLIGQIEQEALRKLRTL